MNTRKFRLSNARQLDVYQIVRFLNERGQDLLQSGPIVPKDELWQGRCWLDLTRAILIRSRTDQRLVATATLHIRYTWRRGIGTIEYVLVDDEFRGNGLGSALVDEIIRQACEDVNPRLDKLELVSEPEHVEARRLYRSRGFKLVEGSDRHFELELS